MKSMFMAIPEHLPDSVGVRGRLLSVEQAKHNCIECACTLLGDRGDQQLCARAAIGKGFKGP